MKILFLHKAKKLLRRKTKIFSKKEEFEKNEYLEKIKDLPIILSRKLYVYSIYGNGPAKNWYTMGKFCVGAYMKIGQL